VQKSLITQFTAPLYVAWEITHRCNANCLHCYSSSGPDADQSTELPLEQALQVIDKLADAGVLILALSGGEPLMHRHWAELIQYAVSRGLIVNVGSNGASITRENARRLRELGVKSVTISLDSHDAEVHDRFRQCEGVFEKAVTAIQRLVNEGVRVVVGFTPTKLNWRDGTKVIDLASRLGADAVNLSEYVPAGRGDTSLALSPDELHEVLSRWINARESRKGEIEIIWHDCRVGLLVPDDEKRSYVGCGAGRLVARIMPDGTVTPCVFLPVPVGNLTTEELPAIWEHSALMQKLRDRQGHVTGNCGACEHLSTCGGCRAVAFAYSHGDPLAGDPHCWLRSMDSHVMTGLIRGEGLPL
jgi:radical SAM protein with 4Fe4S-binding SPASM domain